MRTMLIAAAFGFTLALIPASAGNDLNSTAAIRVGNHICIDSRAILNRVIQDDSTIVFRMNDGTFWKNTLQKPCTGLRIRDSFVLVLRDNFICSNQQRFTVTGQGNVCWFGDFSQTTSPQKAASGG